MDNQEFYGLEGGANSMQEIEQLQKALSVGYESSPENQTGFGATRMESLEKTMKYAVDKEKGIKFWKALKKDKAYSTVEEFAQATKIGGANFYAEGGVPEEYDEELSRVQERVKYIGAIGKVPKPAIVTKSIVDNLATVQNLKTRAILRACEVHSFFGNEEFVPMQWNGVLAQSLKRMKDLSQNVIDLRGRCLHIEDIHLAGKVIEGNHGDPENLKLWMGLDAFEAYSNYLVKEKTMMVGANAVKKLEIDPKNIRFGNTNGAIETDLYLKHKGQTWLEDKHPMLNSIKTAFASTNEKAPNQLDALTAVASVVNDLAVTPLLDAGTYDYAFVPVSNYGAGKAFEVKGVVVTAGKKVTFVLGDNGSPAGRSATAYEIYRKLAVNGGLSDYRYLKTTKASGAEDNGSEIPDTTYSFGFDWDTDEVVTFKQLLPLVKEPLPYFGDSIAWMQKLYGTPIVYNPNRIVIFKNVGVSLT